MAAGLAVLSLGKRGLRHECTQTRVIGFVGELDQLLLGDGEVVARGSKLLADGAEAALDLGLRHTRSYGPSLRGRVRRFLGHDGPMRLVAWACALSLLVVGCGGDDAAEAWSSCANPRIRHQVVTSSARARSSTRPSHRQAGPTLPAPRQRACSTPVCRRKSRCGFSNPAVSWCSTTTLSSVRNLSSSGRSVHRRSWSLLRPRHCRRESSPPPGPGSSRVRPSTSAHSRRLRPNARPTPPVSTDASRGQA